MKDQRVNSLTWEEVFEYDYALSVPESNYFSKTSFSKNFSVVMASVALFFTLSAALYTLDFIPIGKILAPLFFQISLGMLIPICLTIAVSNPLLKWPFFIMFLLVSTLFTIVVVYSPQQPKLITPTAPQSSTSAKPSPSPKPGSTEPLKDSQSIHQKANE